MHGALYDQLMEIGPARIIDPAVCRKHHSSPLAVAHVLTYVIVNTNAQDQFWQSAQTIASSLGVIDGRAVQRAFAVLRELGVMMRGGRRGRATLHLVSLADYDVPGTGNTSQHNAGNTSRTTSRPTSRPTSQGTSHGTYKWKGSEVKTNNARENTSPAAAEPDCLSELIDMVNGHGRRLTRNATLREHAEGLLVHGRWPIARVERRLGELVDLRDLSIPDGRVVNLLRELAAEARLRQAEIEARLRQAEIDERGGNTGAKTLGAAMPPQQPGESEERYRFRIANSRWADEHPDLYIQLRTAAASDNQHAATPPITPGTTNGFWPTPPPAAAGPERTTRRRRKRQSDEDHAAAVHAVWADLADRKSV